MLKLKGVSKSFGSITALQEVSFEVKKGEFVFIVGPSGAGKTTIIKLILKEISPTKGTISFKGKNLENLSDKEIPFHRQKIGVVFQDFKVLKERTLRENVEVALAVIGAEEETWKSRVDKVLKLTGLDTRADLFPAQLSGGELQRVSLARALVVNPDLILADEPTGNLDWDTSFSLMKLFEKINKEGKTIIMATHHKGIVDKMGKRVISLKGGKVDAGKADTKTKKKAKPKTGKTRPKMKVEEV